MNAIINLFSDCLKSFYPEKPRNVPQITLHDGENVSEAAFKSTLLMLEHLHNHQFHTIIEFDLYKKAKDPFYSFPPFPMGPSSPGELQRLGFLDNKSQMNDDIAAIVRNAFKEGRFGVLRTNPLTGEELEKDYSWEQLHRIFAKRE